jgi:hypothetical protein
VIFRLGRDSSQTATKGLEVLTRVHFLACSPLDVDDGDFKVCQQWFSVLGLALEVAGFLIVLYEWRRISEKEMQARMLRIEEDYKKTKAVEKGEELHDPSALDFTMWREFLKLWQKEKQFRDNLFYSAGALIILGFILQIFGSWPGGVFGAKGC